MYYNNKNFYFYYPDKEVGLRLNADFEGETIYVIYNGALRQCKLLGARLTPVKEYSSGWEFVQEVKLNIAGVGIKWVRFTSGTIHDLGKRRYVADTEFFRSIEDFEDGIRCNNLMFYIECVAEFASSIFGDEGVNFHYEKGDGFRCGSVSTGTRYKWDGTRAVSVEVSIPATMTFTPDGGIDWGTDAEKVRDLVENTYFSKKDCEADNSVQVVMFPENERKETKVKTINEITTKKMECEVRRRLIECGGYVSFSTNDWGLEEAFLNDDLEICYTSSGTDNTMLEDYCGICLLMDNMD